MLKNNVLKFVTSKRYVSLSKSYSGMACLFSLFSLQKTRCCEALKLIALAAILLAFFNKSAFAEGSKDLYPAGVSGNRAFLYSNIDGTSNIVSYPFKTQGTHFVYAKAGENIAVASSAVGVGNGRIVVTSPTGVVTTFTASGATGIITNRANELLGPSWPGYAAGYNPFTVPVNVAQEGVWKVDFWASVGANSSNGTNVQDVLANGNWTQNSNTINVVAAWDVSVRNTTGTAWVQGRVYANVLNLLINPAFTEAKAFYVTNYVLTEDGRAYRVKTNGNNGWAFTFFSNNNGFAVGGVPTYKSLNFSNATVATYIHDPRTLDDAINKTHKVFYNKPDPNLPVSANAYVTAANQSMWLKKNVVLPIITNLKITGVEGTEGKISRKGANITFTSSTSGSYQITIPVAGGTDRIINGVAVPGNNQVFWDAKDGAGNFLPAGMISPLVQTFLRSAEVHFPYIDMEVNPRGIIIELTENNTSYTVNPANSNPSEYSDRVYWDDIDISNAGSAARYSSDPVTNLNGISSNTNGHKFGRYNTNANDHFGDNRSMDTWSYIESDRNTHLVNIEILLADLLIESINPDLTKYFSARTITYTIRVQNDGPSPANGSRLAINLPAGLTISSVTQANQTAGITINNAVTGAQSYTATLNLPNQGAIEFLVEATFTGSFNQIFNNTKASILRPADLTDPDATSNNPAGPVDADEECLNGASSGVAICNNIKYNTVNGQDLCQASPITPVSYPLSAGGTQFENSALPPALNFQDAAGVRTVSGSISSFGIHTFYIKTLNTKRTQTNVIIRTSPLPTGTSTGPLSVCVDANDNPAISFKGADGTGSYEFSYTVNNGSTQTVSTPSGSDTATVLIPLTTAGTFTYKLTSIKDLNSGCSQAQNVDVTVTVQPKPTKTHIQLVN